jgi:hypothetical protein
MSKLFCLVILSCLAFACVPTEESDSGALTDLEMCTQMFAKAAVLFAKCDGVTVTLDDVMPTAEQECLSFGCSASAETPNASQLESCIDSMTMTSDCVDLYISPTCEALMDATWTSCDFGEDVPTDTGVDTESNSSSEDTGTGDPDPVDTGTGDAPVGTGSDTSDLFTDFAACRTLIDSYNSFSDKCTVDFAVAYTACDTCDNTVGTSDIDATLECAMSVTVDDACTQVVFESLQCNTIPITSCGFWL